MQGKEEEGEEAGGEAGARPAQPARRDAKGAHRVPALEPAGGRPAAGAGGESEGTPIPLPMSVEADSMDPNSARNRAASTAAAMAAVTAETAAGAKERGARAE